MAAYFEETVRLSTESTELDMTTQKLKVTSPNCRPSPKGWLDLSTVGDLFRKAETNNGVYVVRRLIAEEGATGLTQQSTEVIAILDDNPGEVAKFLAGKTKVMGFFVGQVMKATKGQGNPAVVNRILTEELKSRSLDK
jgi:aspartyl-tRNA(Asn)/glutamyl-tRNA(Gln) amidotransferase subunit B